MATQTLLWCNDCKIDCGSALPTTVYLCVPSSIVVPAVLTYFGFVEATVTGVRASVRTDYCGTCKWIYTITYDDSQVNRQLRYVDIHDILCGCYTDFVVSQFEAVVCDQVYECLDTLYVANEEELIVAEVGSYPNIVVTESFTLTASIEITKNIKFLADAVITTNGNTLTLAGNFEAGNYQVFDTATAEVVFSKDSTSHILLEWFGAEGDGVANDSPAIQLAFDASVANNIWIPVTPLNNKVYGMADTVDVPFRCSVVSDSGRTSGANFSALAAIIMFQFPIGAGGERNINFRGGMTFEGNNLATKIFDMGFVTGSVLDGLNLRGATIGIDHSAGGGGTIDRFTNLRFAGTFDTCLLIGGVSNFLIVEGCMFAAAAEVHIHTDSTWVGGALDILTNVFDVIGGITVDTIRIQRLNNNTPTIHANICFNRFDGGAVTMLSHINIGQFCYVNIQGNGTSGGSGFPGMLVDGDECTITDNYYGNAGLVLSANSRGCNVGYNKWGGGFTTVANAGSDNVIAPFVVSGAGVGYPARTKGTTLQRPVLLSSGMTNFCYADTTLVAVTGQRIFWNDTNWVNAAGVAV